MSPRWHVVPITETLVQQAVTNNCYQCLVALVLHEVTGHQWNVWYDVAHDEETWPMQVWRLPPPVRDLLVRFERGARLELVGEVVRVPRRLGERREG